MDVTKPFGYIEVSEKTFKESNANNYKYFDWEINYSYLSYETFQALLQQMDLLRIGNAVWFKFEDFNHSQTDWCLVSESDTLDWSQPYSVKILSLKFDPSVLFQINDNIFDYRDNDPKVNAVNPNQEDYFINNQSIKESSLLNLKQDFYTKKGIKLKSGFGYLPKYLHYSYIDGGINKYNHKIKNLEDRMGYVLTFNNTTNVLTVRTKKWKVSGNLLNGYSLSPTPYDLVNAETYTFNLGGDAGKQPVICIVVCQPAVIENDTSATRLSARTTNISLSCGVTQYYYLDCSKIGSQGIHIDCSTLTLGSTHIPWALQSYAKDYSYLDKEPWLLSDRQIVQFTSPTITIPRLRNEDGNEEEQSYTTVEKSGNSWTGILNWGIDDSFRKVTDETSLPADIKNDRSFKYEIPDFYSFYADNVHDIYIDNSQSILWNTNNSILETQTYLLYNLDKHKEALIVATPKNFDLIENLPGIGDFPYYPKRDGWKIWNWYPMTFNSFDGYEISDIDKHSLYLVPKFFTSSDWTYAQNNLILQSQALLYWNKRAVNNIRPSTSTRYKKKTDTFTQAEWQVLQNSWGVPLPYTEDWKWNGNDLYNNYPNWQTYNYWNVTATKNSQYSLYNLCRLAYLNGNQYTNFNSIQSIGIKPSTGEVDIVGRYYLGWWKNTCSIPVKADTNDNLIDNPDIYYTFYNYPILNLPSYFDPAQTMQEQTYIDHKRDFEAILTKYNYAYPQSSQAPGAIAIYAVTW